jgi:superfamily II DNA or RNA helicase
MDVLPGSHVRVRGLAWKVLEVDRATHQSRLGLCCIEGDMAGLVWDVYVPPEQVEPVDVRIDPRCPATLSLWHLMHRARVLNEIPAGASFVARAPGRLRVEAYQLVPLIRALDMPRPRLLLADGVGLGKTIQAGLIAAELIARRRAHRILIVTPSGPLLWQWEQETRLRFGLRFTLITNAAELWEVRRTHELGANPFDAVSLCITSLDFAKQDHVLEELERSTWDLVIIDEAHHCVGHGSHASRENTWRRRLAEVLASRSDGLLLLTATPHDGHDAHFASLIALLDPSLVDGSGGFVGNEYRRNVIRRMKIHIRDPNTGAPLFRQRHVVPVKVDVDGKEHETVREFHRALSAFVVPRLRRRKGNEDALAFVSLLKRSVSTILACVETLRVVSSRLTRLQTGDDEERRERAGALRGWRRRTARFGGLDAADEINRNAVEVESMAESLRSESDGELARLIELGVEAETNDPKISALILEIRLIRMRHKRANVLIYTEYTDSQIAAARAIRAAPLIEGEVLTIGGQDDDRARASAADRFAESDALILISTDSMAEGLNLHRHCFHLIHLDLPYNPNRLEQRNGRIDRYGQQQEPEIRYLYIPGTFEESLLLHLIAKYEKARSSLEIMPNTLGVTADQNDYAASLMEGVAENPSDLFQSEVDTIRTLDRAILDSSPETVASIMRELDRAFDAFDLMAVCHGWYGVRGLNAGVSHRINAERSMFNATGSDDLTGFVAAVIEAETTKIVSTPEEIPLPAGWIHDLDGLPGFDPVASVLRVTRDVDTFRDAAGRTVGFLSRAHPTVLRAVRHGCQLPGQAAVAHDDHPGLMLTFEIEIRIADRTVFRQIIAVIARQDRPPVQLRDWLAHGAPEHAVANNEIWDKLFASWAASAQSACELLVSQIASEQHTLFVARYDASNAEEIARSMRWLRVKANQLCGPFVAPTGDLFGDPLPESSRHDPEDPLSRLVSLAADSKTPESKRREANDALETFRAIGPPEAAPGPIECHPVGLLMLVPKDVL